MRRGAFLAVLGLAVVLAGGCLRLGPDFRPPGAPVTLPAAYQHASGRALPREVAWWREFHDPELDRLVALALERNWEIKKAAARVLEFRARFVQASSPLWPRLELSGKAAKEQSPVLADLPGFLSGDRRTETYNLSLAASYELDLWGRLARADEAARAELLAARESRRTVVQTVVAAVVSSYLTCRALQRRLEVAARTVGAFQRGLEVVEGRYRRGLVGALDLHQARRSLAQARARLPGLRLELGREQQRLMVLTGRYPRTHPEPPVGEGYYAAFARLEPVPAGLPAALLKRRPDLRAAEARLKAANARVGEAMAARFPTIRLTAGFGYASRALGGLFTPAGELWSLAAGLTQPLFDAGALAARQRAAQARLQQEAAEYARTVLRAFAEVEGALLARKELLARRREVVAALEAARRAQEAAWERYQRGLSDYLQVLDAMRARYTLEDTLVLVDLALFTNRVTLHRALGGGWDRAALASGREG